MHTSARLMLVSHSSDLQFELVHAVCWMVAKRFETNDLTLYWQQMDRLAQLVDSDRGALILCCQ